MYVYSILIRIYVTKSITFVFFLLQCNLSTYIGCTTRLIAIEKAKRQAILPAISKQSSLALNHILSWNFFLLSQSIQHSVIWSFSLNRVQTFLYSPLSIIVTTFSQHSLPAQTRGPNQIYSDLLRNMYLHAACQKLGILNKVVWFALNRCLVQKV